MNDFSPQTSSVAPTESVGFPTVSQEKKSSPLKWIIFIVIILAAAGGVAFFLLQSSNETIEPVATPSVSGSQTQFTPIPEPSPTPVSVNKDEISIQVLNGTGITGEANYLEAQLKTLGYSKIDKGNASSQNATATTVIFASGVDESVKTEITQKLQALYSKVTVDDGSTGAGIDIKITTGLRKGVTPKASAKPVTAATATPKASGSPSSSPTGSPKPTATP